MPDYKPASGKAVDETIGRRVDGEQSVRCRVDVRRRERSPVWLHAKQLNNRLS